MIRRALIGLGVALAAGCGGAAADRCAGHAGACLGLHVVGAGVSAVDQLQIDLSGAFTWSGRTPEPPGASVALPVDSALFLPEVGGTLSVGVTGRLGGGAVGSGAATVEIAAGRHQTIVLTLRAPASPDLAISDGGASDALVADAAGADFAGDDLASADFAAPADLAVPADLKSPPPDFTTPPDLIFANARLTFILSERAGSFGPKSSLDSQCSLAASSAGLPAGSYVGMVAWPGADPANFVTLVAGRRVVLPDGTQVATDDTLFAADHNGPINKQANGGPPTQICAWTNFDATGHTNNMGDCAGWTINTNASAGAFGKPGSWLSGLWAFFTSGRTCDQPCHVYCIQQ